MSFAKSDSSLCIAFRCALLIAPISAIAQERTNAPEGCFYSTLVGNKLQPVKLCAGGDPLNLADSPVIIRIMQVLGVDPSTVEFRGCPGQPFKASPPSKANGSSIYSVSYPLEVGDEFVAPITHELAHVLQMQEAGGYYAAVEVAGANSQRIELGADYLTGLVFAKLRGQFPELNTQQFQHSASLLGLYKEREIEAHGTPDQRTAAFRYGFINAQNQYDPATAYKYFLANIYADIGSSQSLPNSRLKFKQDSEEPTSIKLDKLTACDEILDLYENLEPIDSDAVCATAKDEVTRAVLSKLNSRIASQVCVLARVPSGFLDGFNCFMPPAGRGVELTCIREVDAADIKRFKNSYKDEYSIPVLKYLSEASKCSASNGDSAPAQTVLMSSYLQPIAALEFGFVTVLGQAQPPNSHIVHGFATIDPRLNVDPTAIEFVQLLARIEGATVTYTHKHVGSWNIEVDELNEVEKELNNSYRGSGVPAWVDGRAFDLEREGTPEITQVEKLRLLKSLYAAAGRGLDDEGFDEYDIEDDEYVKNKLKMMLDTMSAQRPYGWNDIPQVRFSENIGVFTKFDRTYCSGSMDDGMLATYLFESEPRENVAKDFGGILVFVYAFGSCTISTHRLKVYADDLLDVVEDRVTTALREP